MVNYTNRIVRRSCWDWEFRKISLCSRRSSESIVSSPSIISYTFSPSALHLTLSIASFPPRLESQSCSPLRRVDADCSLFTTVRQRRWQRSERCTKESYRRWRRK